MATRKPQTISYPAPGSRPHRTDDFAVDPHVVVLFGATGGDQTLFTTAEGIESLWERSADLLAEPPPTKTYPPGTWGPKCDPSADRAERVAAAV